ncbi:MAG: DUF2723 domain-containing protein [Myxococcota bacterium]
MSDRFLRYRWWLLLPLAAIYFASLPHAVQTLDSGELVTSAWGLTVPHAPGYPLYVWLYHALMKAVPVSTVFFRAALITAICALGAAAFLLRVCRRWLGVAAIAAMASLPAIWRYAVLPDVFGLNQVLAAALIALAFSPASKTRPFVAAAVFGLAAGNHHSIVFLAPLLLLIVWQEPNRLRGGAALLVGAAISVALYASLPLLDTEHVNSWGSVTSFRGVLHHFLRRDYGTFNLSTGGGVANIGAVTRDLVVTVGPFGLPALALLGLGAAKARPMREHQSWWVLLGCLALYLFVFVPRMNLAGDDSNAVLLRERFFLLPILMLTALAVTASVDTLRVSFQHGLLLATALLALVQCAIGDTYGLRRDVVVEEYMRNLLKTAVSQRTPAIVIVDSDTKFFGARYVQATEPGYDDVFILPRSMTFDRRLLERAKKRWPHLYYDEEKVRTRVKMDIYAQFLAPNMEAFSITHVMPFTSPRGKTTYYPVGRALTAGAGSVIADVPPLNPTPPVYRAGSSDYVDTKEIFAEYAVYYLARGKDLLAKGDKQGAHQAFMDGLARVPYCVPCLRGACELEVADPRLCDGAVGRLEHEGYDYFK